MFTGSSEAAWCSHVQSQCSDEGSQGTDEAKDWRRQSCVEEEDPGSGEGVGESVSDVSGQTEQTRGRF